jgi:hypothetical protein
VVCTNKHSTGVILERSQNKLSVRLRLMLISVKCKSYTYFRSQNKFSLQTQTSLMTVQKPRKCALSLALLPYALSPLCNCYAALSLHPPSLAHPSLRQDQQKQKNRQEALMIQERFFQESFN